MLKFLRISFAALMILSALTVNSWALSVYVMSAGDSQDNQAILNTLRAAGHDPVLGVDPSEWDGSQADLSEYDVVVLSLAIAELPQDMPKDGQVALISYVQQGGGLVTGERLVWLIYNNVWFQDLDLIIPVKSMSGGFVAEPSTKYRQCRKKTDPILNNGLPTNFTFSTAEIAGGSESLLLGKKGATTYYRTSANGKLIFRTSGVVGWKKESGRVISFSTLFTHIELSDINYATLFVNAVEWAGSSGADSD
ncbi:MAG: hypothetical protein NT096_16760 [Proteobacteria bacterium]|nr:hypothetical protein [Pseudomonadota bacterium]